MRRLGILVAGIFLLAGCETFSIQKYSLSSENTDVLRGAMSSGQVTSVAVGDFTATSPGQFEMQCGMNGQMRTPQHTPFEKYIREAFIDELKKAGAYSLDQIEAGRVITGHLDKIKMNSEKGSWDIDLTIEFKSGAYFTVSESYQFEGASCEQTAAALVPAVQDLIHRIITHPTFQGKMEKPEN
jgi:hypothetical protein